jgi:hypothetical protein
VEWFCLPCLIAFSSAFVFVEIKYKYILSWLQHLYQRNCFNCSRYQLGNLQNPICLIIYYFMSVCYHYIFFVSLINRHRGWGPENKYYFLNADGHITLSTTRATYPKFMSFLRTELKNVCFSFPRHAVHSNNLVIDLFFFFYLHNPSSTICSTYEFTFISDTDAQNAFCAACGCASGPAHYPSAVP